MRSLSDFWLESTCILISFLVFIGGLPLGLGCNPKIPSSKYRFCHMAIRLGLSKLNNSAVSLKDNLFFHLVSRTLRLKSAENTCLRVNVNIRMYNFDDVQCTVIPSVAYGFVTGMNLQLC